MCRKFNDSSAKVDPVYRPMSARPNKATIRIQILLAMGALGFSRLLRIWQLSDLGQALKHGEICKLRTASFPIPPLVLCSVLAFIRSIAPFFVTTILIFVLISSFPEALSSSQRLHRHST